MPIFSARPQRTEYEPAVFTGIGLFEEEPLRPENCYGQDEPERVSFQPYGSGGT